MAERHQKTIISYNFKGEENDSTVFFSIFLH